VIARVDDKRVGFVVDQVIGGHQTRHQEPRYALPGGRGSFGATILGDGTVALILDVPRLAQIAEADEVSLASAGGLRTLDN